jgi:hypothetical protein
VELAKLLFNLFVLILVIIVSQLYIENRKLKTNNDRLKIMEQKYYDAYINTHERLVVCWTDNQKNNQTIGELLDIVDEYKQFKREHQCIKTITDSD